ncbi:MAG: hypothetical protein KC620_12065 [Myxococcales bacterium]|nr:hypothetical protein [Myxococcales bacterium]
MHAPDCGAGGGGGRSTDAAMDPLDVGPTDTGAGHGVARWPNAAWTQRIDATPLAADSAAIIALTPGRARRGCPAAASARKLRLIGGAMRTLTRALLGLLTLGCHAAAGPQVGYTFDRGLSYGWEAGGGLLYLHGNLGQVFRPAKRGAASDGREWVGYLVAEPWYYAGATLGAAYGQHDGVGFAGGLWEAYVIPLAGFEDKREFDFDCFDDTCRPTLSLAGGVRYLNGEWELYATPKVGFFQTVDFF